MKQEQKRDKWEQGLASVIVLTLVLLGLVGLLSIMWKVSDALPYRIIIGGFMAFFGLHVVLQWYALFRLHRELKRNEGAEAAALDTVTNAPAQTGGICKEETEMLIVNIDHIPGKNLEALGMAKGTIVYSKNFGKDFMASVKGLVGGELEGYTEMLNEARQMAVKRMVDEAAQMGADAVVNVRYGSASMMAGAAEVIAYGTAVKYV